MNQITESKICSNTYSHLTVSIHSCSHYYIDMNEQIYNEDYMFCYVSQGVGQLHIGNMTRDIGKGCFFVCFPDEAVSIEAVKRESLHIISLAFSGYMVDNYLSRAGITMEYRMVEDNEENHLSKLFEDVSLAASMKLNRYCKLASGLFDIFHYLINLRRSHPVKGKVTKDDLLEFALLQINEHVHEQITVEDIAQSLGISRKYLYKIFREKLHCSPNEYIKSCV